ncbi:MAG: DUF1700 domain-containing protein [Terriglobales bacterium]
MTMSGHDQPNVPTDAQKEIENYLSKLRQSLRGLNDQDAREIIEELRSHIIEKSATGGQITIAAVVAALAGLGDPEDLASQYTTDNLLARAEVSRSPFRILKSLCRWASLSIAGFFVLLGSFLGYFFGAVLMLVAVLKLIHPHSAGLWIFPKANGELDISFRLGFGSVPAAGRDVLGWWIVPLGWTAGSALVMLTTYIAVWFVRQYRKSLVLPQG